ncbi:MAG: class I SAM-dependent methyltransferase [Thermoplasmata archaeon]
MPPSRSPKDPTSEARRRLGDPRARPAIPWIARLTDRSPDEVVSTLGEVREFLDIERAIRARHTAYGRSFYAQFRAPFDLYAMVRLLEPEHVVETGVSSGVSSAHALIALRRNGHGTLHSIDRPTFQRGPRLARRESVVSIPPGCASGWAIPQQLTQGWDLRVGDSSDVLPPLVKEIDSVGLFLHDSHHTPKHLTFELTTVQPKLTPGAIVMADNTSSTGRAFPRFAGQLRVPVWPRNRSDLVGLRVSGPART